MSRNTPLSEISGIKERCTGRPYSYTLDGRTYRSLNVFLEAALEMSLKEIMEEYYERRKMSGTDIARHFSDLFGFPILDRMIYYALKKSGVRSRGYAERKSLSWKQGKMEGAISKMRQTCKRSYMLGSKAEQTVRFMLRQGLLILDAEWDAIIGDNLQHILDRFEVDIPLVLIDRRTGRACRIAIEVDNRFTHSESGQLRRDERKAHALERAGWRVLRVDGDDFDNRENVAAEMTDLMLKVKRVAEEAFLEKSFQA